MASGNHGASTKSSGTSNASGGESVSKVIVQYTMDTRLHAVFEQSGKFGRSFDCLDRRSDKCYRNPLGGHVKIQRGGHVQPFGCTLAVDEPAASVAN